MSCMYFVLSLVQQFAPLDRFVQCHAFNKAVVQYCW